MKPGNLPKIILIVLIIGLIGELLLYLRLHEFDDLVRITTAFGINAALIILLKEGVLIRSKLFLTLTALFVVIIIIGLFFKILHWEGADFLLLLGFSGVPLVYTIHFLLKKNKIFLDYLKMIWILLLLMGSMFTIFHWPYGNLMLQLQGTLFLILYVVFVIRLNKMNRVIDND